MYVQWSPTLLWLFLWTADCTFYKDNITDFSKCQVYYSRTGSVYENFFEIVHHTDGLLLDFHFSVIAASDAHILLAPSDKIDKGDPVYEIVIGAGGNTFCDIRRMQKSSVRATKRIKGLLSALDMQSFWVHISQDGIIEVGKEGEELAFLSWIDPDPLPLKVFSFSTWPGVEAKWYFNCPRANTSEHSKELERPLTPLEKLRRDLLYNYDPYVRPVFNLSAITRVGLSMSSKLASLDEHKAVFKYMGSVKMTWTDEKLNWNPSNYSDINAIHIFRREIWVPDLHLFNSVIGEKEILEDSNLVVNSSGSVTWTTSLNIKTFCDAHDLGRWPRDEHNCDVTLGFFKDFQNIQLIFSGNDSKFLTPYSDRWEIVQVEFLANMGWKNSSARNVLNLDPPALNVCFKLRRTTSSYTIILYTPFFVIAISLLMSFWVSPFGPLKMSLACLQLILSSIILIGLGLIVPIHSKLVPNLVLLYSYGLIATLISVLISVIVINLSRNEQKYSLPRIIKEILTSCWLKFILCLPDKKTSDNYGNLNESTSKLNEDLQGAWILLGVVIDRLAFFVYLALAIYAVCITY